MGTKNPCYRRNTLVGGCLISGFLCNLKKSKSPGLRYTLFFFKNQAQIWLNFKNIVVNLYVAISISFRSSV